ncbi:uncharacterized protein EV420DRAFT_1637455 [Desarmillaria tabescens]|uniref:BTB domain-containing protein n=1 Tax=Armillaria tabescens TaxID=1929756 RepID=A0AA39NGP5_ARMTA|nr:uncharacterized protein EV420DRAFT_1637455 [Desarmillaria tabescens]KAK0465309.1 hypothetical protein EV420DRAFT_1637455 [Desarmillaria tabescens]
MSMVLTAFECLEPDIIVSSIPDNQVFHASRKALQNSNVFRDMFSCCDSRTTPADQIVRLDEHASNLTVLLNVLHNPPGLPIQIHSYTKHYRDRNSAQSYHLFQRQYDPGTVIPLPVIPLLLTLADKYCIESITETLSVHLSAHAPIDPLRVYGYAVAFGLGTAASTASQYLDPMASYDASQVEVIPTVAAYHRVLVLQNFRVQALRRILSGEEIFPHGYGLCTSHQRQTTSLWEARRTYLLGRIQSNTDVACEMDIVRQLLADCKICHKACSAAVDMLGYKCRRVIRRVDQLKEATDGDDPINGIYDL